MPDEVWLVALAAIALIITGFDSLPPPRHP